MLIDSPQRIGILVTLILVSSSPLAHCQTAPKKVPFAITISADRSEVKSGAQVVISVQRKNLFRHTIDCRHDVRNAVDRAYRYEIWDATGRLLSEKTRKHPEIGEEFNPQPTCLLKPAATDMFSSVISTLYDLTLPGEYTVQLCRPASNKNAKSGMICSNKIVVTVTP